MVPNPDAVFIPLATDAGGELPLSTTWPLGRGGYTFWAQYWIVDPAGPAAFTASTAVRTGVPWQTPPRQLISVKASTERQEHAPGS